MIFSQAGRVGSTNPCLPFLYLSRIKFQFKEELVLKAVPLPIQSSGISHYPGI